MKFGGAKHPSNCAYVYVTVRSLSSTYTSLPGVRFETCVRLSVPLKMRFVWNLTTIVVGSYSGSIPIDFVFGPYNRILK